MQKHSYEIVIEGIVQGVGFRPFVYKLAQKHRLTGFVYNTSGGVVVLIQGNTQDIDAFIHNLSRHAPPLSCIQNMTVEPIKKCATYGEFSIKLSKEDTTKTALLLPDIKTCPQCLKDLEDSTSHFYNYFAINCTRCGPRYSIIKTLPYDRANSSMDAFALCSECAKEYHDPKSRRFHAQPIACPNCGPKLCLLDKEQNPVKGDAIQQTAKLLRQGKIGAIKGIGGFHLVCDSSIEETIYRLREYKNRVAKPFALMCKDVAMVKSVAYCSEKEKEVLQSYAAPIVILQKKQPLEALAPRIDKVGCMLAYTPLHHLLFKHLHAPIIATSANLGNEPIIIDAKSIYEKLSFVDFVLDFNREIINAVDDSLVQIVDEKVQVLRGARGYMPLSIALPKKVPHTLALGAQQKSTIAIAFDKTAVLSPHIGDLDSVHNLAHFNQMITNFQRFYDFVPQVLVGDKHPGYESTKWAQRQKIEHLRVQHHKAHLQSVKLEHNLSREYLGFIFDGTGLGDDGTIWGGEVFLGADIKYRFKHIKLLGGAKAVREPKRVALAMLFEQMGLEEVLQSEYAPVKAFSTEQIRLLHHAFVKDINAPKTSSVGRLFDAMASFADLLHESSYEGQSGLLLEANHTDNDASFEFTITHEGVIEIEFFKVLQQNFQACDLATMFINTLVTIIITLAHKEQKDIILSGGVFQNKTLLQKLLQRCKKEDIRCYFNQKIPINDGGISIGQIGALLDT